MSEFLTINTADNIITHKQVEPLPLYDENYYMLKQVIPEYQGVLPNPIMDTLIRRLKMTMKLYGGIGLAANQCGVSERLFIIGHEESSFACINPKVLEVSENIVRDKEGCLSFPGLFFNVPRAEWIIAEYTDEQGETQTTKIAGLTARCYLHELDHLNGIKYTEHVGPASVNIARRRQKKIVKTMQQKLKR